MAYNWNGMSEMPWKEVQERHQTGKLAGCYKCYPDGTEEQIDSDYYWEEMQEHYECGGKFGEERLTERLNDELGAIWVKDHDYITAAHKLADYEDLDEQGKLLKLPCAVGDTVWDNDFGRPCSYEVTGFSFGNLNDGCVEEEMVLDQVLVYYTNSTGSITGSFAVSEIGKTVFFTKEEAKATLQQLNEMEG